MQLLELTVGPSPLLVWLVAGGPSEARSHKSVSFLGLVDAGIDGRQLAQVALQRQTCVGAWEERPRQMCFCWQGL